MTERIERANKRERNELTERTNERTNQLVNQATPQFFWLIIHLFIRKQM